MNLESMLIRAFDPVASNDEARDAFNQARQEMLTKGIKLSDLFRKPDPVPKFQFPFGKYKGKAILDVAAYDIAYLQWFFDNMDQAPPTIINYLRSVLDMKLASKEGKG